MASRSMTSVRNCAGGRIAATGFSTIKSSVRRDSADEALMMVDSSERVAATGSTRLKSSVARGGIYRLLKDGEDFVRFRGLRSRFRSEAEQRAVVFSCAGPISESRVGNRVSSEVMQNCVGGGIVECGETGAEVGFGECRKVEFGDRPEGQIGPAVRPRAKHSGRLTHAVRASRRKASPTDLGYEVGRNGTLG